MTIMGQTLLNPHVEDIEDSGVVTDAEIHVFYGKVTIMGQQRQIFPLLKD